MHASSVSSQHPWQGTGSESGVGPWGPGCGCSLLLRDGFNAENPRTLYMWPIKDLHLSSISKISDLRISQVLCDVFKISDQTALWLFSPKLPTPASMQWDNMMQIEYAVKIFTEGNDCWCVSVLTWLPSAPSPLGSLDTTTAAETCTPAWTVSLECNQT